MRILSKIMLLIVLVIALSGGYVAAAVFTSAPYDDLSMKTTYNWAYFQKKAVEVSKGIITNPTKPLMVKLSDQEAEGLVKLALQDSSMRSTIKGVKISLENGVIVARINVSIAGLDKGVQLSVKPSLATNGQLQFAVEGLKIGKFYLPVTPSLLAAKAAALPAVMFSLEGNTIVLNLKNVPFEIKSINVQPNSLTAELVVSPKGLLQMATSKEAFAKVVVKNAETIKNGVQSKEATAFINQIEQNQEITTSDVEQANRIYENLSPAEREALRKNMGSLLQDPEVQEMLKEYGIKP